MPFCLNSPTTRPNKIGYFTPAGGGLLDLKFMLDKPIQTCYPRNALPDYLFLYRKEARRMKNTVFMQLNFAVAGVKYALLTELPDTLRAFRGK